MPLFVRSFVFGITILFVLTACGGGGSECNDFTATITAPAENPCSDPSPTIPDFDPSTFDFSSNRTITGAPFCGDGGGTAEFGCRLIPQGAPPNIGLTITNDVASISIEIANMQHIELIDTDSDPERIAIAVFVTNNGIDSASVSMRIHLTDENGLSIYNAIATIGTFTPGFSGLVAFAANPNFQNVSPIIYHGMRLDVDVAEGPITFGEFSQANIYPIDPSSSVGN